MGKGKKSGGSKSNASNYEAGRDASVGASGRSSKNRHRGSGGGAESNNEGMLRSGSSTDLASRLSPQVLSGNTWNLIPSLKNYQGGFHWIAGCIVLCWIFGYAIGAGWTDLSGSVSPWRKAFGKAIRDSTPYQLATFRAGKWEEFLNQSKGGLIKWIMNFDRNADKNRIYEMDPSHPYTFALLREAVIREKGGYVHHDLGILTPAPSGASRGLGMVSNTYHACQSQCLPGTASEKLDWKNKLRKCGGCNETCDEECNQLNTSPTDGQGLYKQEEVLIRVPLSFQMTRSVAIDTLSPLIPADVQTKNNFHALDDGAMLVLLLAHERGVGRFSRWYPYTLSLPNEPTCGYSRKMRPHLLDALEAMKHELRIDVEGWSAELVKASMYADRIANSLNTDYGQYIQTPEGISTFENIRWCLCQVASRATAGNEESGALRMVPIADLINHDINAGGFKELTGRERLEKGDMVDAIEEDDKGAFVVRSLRHGQRRPLRKGQELMVNYNVPLFTPLDWFISMGFVPSERWGPWEKVDAVLPQVRRDGPFAETTMTSKEQWEKDASFVLNEIQGREAGWE